MSIKKKKKYEHKKIDDEDSEKNNPNKNIRNAYCRAEGEMFRVFMYSLIQFLMFITPIQIQFGLKFDIIIIFQPAESINSNF